MARKEKNIHYIYKTTCNITGKWYIGMHSAYIIDDGYMGSGKVLRRSIRKYGVENHTREILEYCDTREILILRETEIVNKELISDGLCMNLKEGGKGGFANEEHMKKAQKGGHDYVREKLKNDPEFRAKWIETSYKNLVKYIEKNGFQKDGFKGKNHSIETKNKLSEIAKQRTGEKSNQYGTCWITKEGENKKIKKEEIETYINDGWTKGRVCVK